MKKSEDDQSLRSRHTQAVGEVLSIDLNKDYNGQPGLVIETSIDHPPWLMAVDAKELRRFAQYILDEVPAPK